MDYPKKIDITNPHVPPSKRPGINKDPAVPVDADLIEENLFIPLTILKPEVSKEIMEMFSKPINKLDDFNIPE